MWCEEVSLCEAFPSLFALEINKEVLVVDVLESSWEEGG